MAEDQPVLEQYFAPTRGYLWKQLGQARDNDTNTHSVYSPVDGLVALVKTITLANTSSSAANIRVFLDDDGTTYDQTTALLYDVSIPANTTIVLEGWYGMDDSDGNLAYQQGTANAITITVFGGEAVKWL